MREANTAVARLCFQRATWTDSPFASPLMRESLMRTESRRVCTILLPSRLSPCSTWVTVPRVTYVALLACSRTFTVRAWSVSMIRASLE